MAQLFYLSESQLVIIRKYFPLRNALNARGITPCIPPKKNRRIHIEYDKTLYKQRYKIKIMSGRLKDCRRIAMRYDRCAHTFFSAICIVATMTFYLGVPCNICPIIYYAPLNLIAYHYNMGLYMVDD